jgi:nitric oxide reductase large subunit
MYRLLSLLLLVAGIALAFTGYSTYQDATADVSFLGLDLSLSDQEAKQTAMLYFLGAGVCLLAAIGLFRKS